MFKIENLRSENTYELKHLLKNSVFNFDISMGENYVVVNQLLGFWVDFDKRECTYLSMFWQDPTFRIKFTYYIDRLLQVLLSSFS